MNNDLDPRPAMRLESLLRPGPAGSLMMFGGLNRERTDGSVPSIYLNDLWQHGVTGWTQLAPAAPLGSPQGRALTAGTWDPDGQRLLFFGGLAESEGVCPTGSVASDFQEICTYDDFWSWTASDGAWQPLAAGPPPRFDGRLVWDSSRGVAVLFGGAEPGRGGDCPLGVVVGSACNPATVWEWSDAGGWHELVPLDPEGDGSPDGRIDHTMMYDAERGRTLLFGGDSEDPETCDGQATEGFCKVMWEWRGVSWARMSVSDPRGVPPPDPDASVARVVPGAFGRPITLVARNLGDTLNYPARRWVQAWEWSSGADERPAHVLPLGRSALGGLAASAELDVLAAMVRWTAGGAGPSDAPTNPGAQLRVWDGVDWIMADTDSSASLDEPATLTWQADAAERQRLFTFGNTLRLAVTPLAGNAGGGFASIATDHLEVRLRYRVTP